MNVPSLTLPLYQVRSAKTYWHVQAPETAGVSRIYPDVYKPKVVGMMWSMLAQEQVNIYHQYYCNDDYC